MKTYTYEEMVKMTKKEVSSIALELGLKLSYKDSAGKRQRYTISQLIDMIEDAQEVEYVEVLPEKKDVSSIYGEHGTTQTVVSYDIKSIMSKLKTINSIEQLQEFKVEVSNYFNRLIKSKNKRAKKIGSLEMNRITMLFKQYELKIKQ